MLFIELKFSSFLALTYFTVILIILIFTKILLKLVYINLYLKLIFLLIIYFTTFIHIFLNRKIYKLNYFIFIKSNYVFF